MISFGWKWKKRALELDKKVVNLNKQLKNAESIILKISESNFEFIEDDSQNSLLILLRKLGLQMKEYSLHEIQREWISEGLGNFVDILRKDQAKKEELYNQILSSLVKYLKANQGGLFLLSPNESELQLVASYAYDKKRYLDKSIKIGEGLLGQCFLEEETTLYTDIPPFYTAITSGLGDATPNCLILVPLKFNDKVLGVIELASFNKFQKYEIDFLEKIAESIASVYFNIRNAENSRTLLFESEQREQMLKEQEEELRQNLEELVATQEEMKGKQMEVDQQSSMMKLIIDNIPFPIFVKDELGKYSMVNKAEAALFKMEEINIIGKDDSHFVENENEWKVIQESDIKTLDSELPIELPIQSFTTSSGTTHIFKTTKIPFINSLTGKKNILGVSVDLTEKLDLEKKLLKEKIVSTNNSIIDLAGRQRMLSQKIGFYSEMVFRGKLQHIEELRYSIALHEHSLNVLKNGGLPKGIENAQTIEKVSDSLIPFITKVEELWVKYKKATENIIELKTRMEGDVHAIELERSIQLIEEVGELLLVADNDLLKAFYQKNKKSLVDSF